MATTTRVGDNGDTWAIAPFTGAQTDAAVIAAPGAGKALLLLGWKWSTSLQATLTLEDEDDGLIDQQYAAADGGQVVGFSCQVAANKAVQFTSTAGDAVVGVLYRTIDV